MLKRFLQFKGEHAGRVRLRRIHRAWVWGLALTLPWVIATEFVWGSHWWRTFGPRLVGAR